MSILDNQKPNGQRLNQLRTEDRPFHDWYRFVLSFPPHLVRDYLDRFNISAQDCVLDPFCGTGTTMVESKRRGVPSVGIEPSPMAHLAAVVKTDWMPDPEGLVAHAEHVAHAVRRVLKAHGLADFPGPLFENDDGGSRAELRTLDPQRAKLLLKNSISPRPLHKTLILLEALEANRDARFFDHERLALARCLVTCIGNLHFGPEVGVTTPKKDAAVLAPWLDQIRIIARDLREQPTRQAEANILRIDARHLEDKLKPASISAVITSPPYPNEKDYTRTTRLESVLFGLIPDRVSLRAWKQKLVRSNTRGVYKSDVDDPRFPVLPEVEQIAAQIERRRVEMGKTSGFERTYHRVTRLYFGGMASHLGELRRVLRPGARLAYVVGDQASYLRVMIRTGALLAKSAEQLGYEVESIDLFRTRLATATGEQLREEVVVLRWPG